MVSAFRAFLVLNAPVGSGYLIKNLYNSKGSYSQKAPGHWVVEIGNKSKFGLPSDDAPRGTIKDFLREYPQFRKRKRRLRQNRNRKGQFKSGYTPGWIASNYAWWALSAKAKQKLQEERLRGRFGGESGVGAGRSPYLWVQDKGTAQGRASAQAAGLNKTGEGHFIQRALKDWRSTWLPGYLNRVIRGR